MNSKNVRILRHANLYRKKWVTRERNCKLRDTSNDRTGGRGAGRKKRKIGQVAMRKRPVATCKCPIGHEQKIGVSYDAKIHESLSDCNVGRGCECESDIFNLVPIGWF